MLGVLFKHLKHFHAFLVVYLEVEFLTMTFSHYIFLEYLNQVLSKSWYLSSAALVIASCVPIFFLPENSPNISATKARKDENVQYLLSQYESMSYSKKVDQFLSNINQEDAKKDRTKNSMHKIGSGLSSSDSNIARTSSLSRQGTWHNVCYINKVGYLPPKEVDMDESDAMRLLHE